MTTFAKPRDVLQALAEISDTYLALPSDDVAFEEVNKALIGAHAAGRQEGLKEAAALHKRLVDALRATWGGFEAEENGNGRSQILRAKKMTAAALAEYRKACS